MKGEAGRHGGTGRQHVGGSVAHVPVLIVPGIGDSGPRHWQSLWQARHTHWRRVVQQDWNHPRCEEWVQTLEAGVAASSLPPILVAHSIGCLVVARWASRSAQTVRGAFLVAVPDPDVPAFPSTATGFALLPQERFPFPSLVVASADDPFGSVVHARRCADAWGSDLVDIGPGGHINADSGHGPWPEGWSVFERFVVETERPR